MSLSDEDVDRIARRVVLLLTEQERRRSLAALDRLLKEREEQLKFWKDIAQINNERPRPRSVIELLFG